MLELGTFKFLGVYKYQFIWFDKCTINFQLVATW